MKKSLMYVVAVFLFFSFTADKPAYRLYDSGGEAVKYKKLVKEASEADVILFGELHNNPVCHWLQIELTRDLYESVGQGLVLGAEMFEADNQEILDELVSGTIRMKDFENEARLWPNFGTDYKPLVEFAVEKKLKFVATNVPRRYAALVSRRGFEMLDSLPHRAKKWIVPLPVPYDSGLMCYKEMLAMMGPGHSDPNLPKAQALKDATMAWNILQNLHSGQKFIHFNGTYHSDNFEGIAWYLNYWRPGLKIVTLASASVPDPEEFPDDLKGKATFILTVHERMTATH